MTTEVRPAAVDVKELRVQVQRKYGEVAETPDKGFHFHTGAPLARMLGYSDEVIAGLPEGAVASFAGTGNPFTLGPLPEGARVVDVGCGAGFDSLQAARQVGPEGAVLGIDMTPAMVQKAAAGAAEAGITNVAFRRGLAEELPVEDAFADVVISNGVINLCPDKLAVMREVSRVLRPGGHIQIADIVVHTEVPQSAKDDIDLWSG